MSKQRWAALAKDGTILQIGLTTHGRFERQCFPFSCFGYMKWAAEGARYTELLVESFDGMFEKERFRYNQLNIRDYPHGPIRRCKSARRVF